MKKTSCDDSVTGHRPGASTPAGQSDPPACGSHGEISGLISSPTKNGGYRPGAGRKRQPALPPPSSAPRWYCCQVDRRSEADAADRLRLQGFEVLLQKMVERLPGRSPRVVSAFPGYLFVRFAMIDGAWRSIPSTRGVIRLFSTTPERPQPLPIGCIEALLAKARSTGLIDEGLPPEAIVRPGATVQIDDGVLQGFRGICGWSSSTRIALLVTMFGQDVSVVLARGQVRMVGM